MTNTRQNNLIRHAYVLIIVAVLVTTVWVLYKVVGLPFILAMLAGGPVLLVVSRVIIHPFLPPPPPPSDEERVQMPKIRPMWVLLGVAAASLLSLGTRMPLPISLLLAVVLIGPLIAGEKHERRKAKRRLEIRQEGTTPPC